MEILLIIVHVLVCFALIGIVLLQQGKGADIGAAFGGASQTLFGSSGGTTFLGKLTAGAAILFMVTSLGLGLVTRSELGAGGSIVEEPEAPAQTAAPIPVPPPLPTEEPAQAPAPEAPQK